MRDEEVLSNEKPPSTSSKFFRFFRSSGTSGTKEGKSKGSLRSKSEPLFEHVPLLDAGTDKEPAEPEVEKSARFRFKGSMKKRSFKRADTAPVLGAETEPLLNWSDSEEPETSHKGTGRSYKKMLPSDNPPKKNSCCPCAGVGVFGVCFTLLAGAAWFLAHRKSERRHRRPPTTAAAAGLFSRTSEK